MYRKAALLLIFVWVGSAAVATETLRDIPGPSAQLKGFLPVAPKGWSQKQSALGNALVTPAFPWASALYVNSDGYVDVTIAAGVSNKTHREINQILNDREIAAKNGIEILTIKRRHVLGQHLTSGSFQFALNVGRDISVIIISTHEESGKEMLKLINLDQLEKLEQ